MGCGSSKSAMVAPQRVNEAWTKCKDEGTPENTSTPASPNAVVQSVNASGRVVTDTGSNQMKGRQDRISEDSTQGSLIMVKPALDQPDEKEASDDSQSLGSSVRTNSAESAFSKGTHGSSDSGLGEDYTHIITEHSDKEQQKIAELTNRMQPTNLTVECQSLSSSHTHGHRKRVTLPSHRPPQPNRASIEQDKPLLRARFAQDEMLELPESPSIVKRPVSRGGLAFDVFLGDNGDDAEERGNKWKTPAVRKLERRSKDLPSKHLLLEQQKLAEERRKERERQMVEKFHARKEKEREIREAMAKFIALQSDKSANRVDQHSHTHSLSSDVAAN